LKHGVEGNNNKGFFSDRIHSVIYDTGKGVMY